MALFWQRLGPRSDAHTRLRRLVLLRREETPGHRGRWFSFYDDSVLPVTEVAQTKPVAFKSVSNFGKARLLKLQ